MKQMKSVFCAPNKLKVDGKCDDTSDQKDTNNGPMIDKSYGSNQKVPKFEKNKRKQKSVPRSLTEEEYSEIFKSVLDAAVENDIDATEVKPEVASQSPAIEIYRSKARETDDELDVIAGHMQIDDWNDGAIDKSGKAMKMFQAKMGETEKRSQSEDLQRKKKIKKTIKTPRTKVCSNTANVKALDQRLRDDKNVTNNQNGQTNDDQEENEEPGTWIQCSSSKCGKWRYVADIGDPTQVPEYWECSMSSDKDHNTCDTPETEYDESDHILTQYTLGSVVWAKMDGFPWWPAMVDTDPDYETYLELPSESSMIPYLYHVTFFDEHVSRAWIKSHFLAPYSAQSPTEKISSKKVSSQRKDLQNAKANADMALKLDLPERLKHYSFVKRFSKSKRSQDKNTSRKRTNAMKQRNPMKNHNNISADELLSSSSKMLQELDQAIKICNTSGSDGDTSEEDDGEYLPKLDTCNDNDIDKKKSHKTSLPRSKHFGKKDILNVDTSLGLSETKSKSENCDNIKNITGNDVQAANKDCESNDECNTKDKAVKDKAISNSHNEESGINRNDAEYPNSEAKDNPLLTEDTEDKFKLSNLTENIDKKKRKLMKNAPKLQCLDGSSSYPEEAKPDVPSTSQIGKMRRIKLKGKIQSDSTNDGDQKDEKNKNELKFQLNDENNEQQSISEVDSEKENKDPNCIFDEEKDTFSRKQINMDNCKDISRQKAKSKKASVSNKKSRKSETIRSSSKPDLGQGEENDNRDLLDGSFKRKMEKSSDGTKKKMKRSLNVEEYVKNNEQITNSQSTEEDHFKLLNHQNGKQTVSDNAANTNSSSRNQNGKSKPSVDKQEKAQEDRLITKVVSTSNDQHPLSSKKFKGKKSKSFMNPLRDTSTKPYDRKVPNISCVEDKGKNDLPKCDTQNDQSVPDVTAIIPEDDVELTLNQDMPIPEKHIKDKIGHDEPDGYSSNEDELNLSIDSLEVDSQGGADLVSRVGDEVKQSYGRFGGHCSDLGSQSDPFELIEE